MKRIVLLIAALAFSLTAFAAEPETARNTYKQHYDFRDFDALSISHIYHVELSFENTWSVDVEVPDYLEPYLRISCKGGKLRLGLENLPKDIQKRLSKSNDRLHAWVRMPGLRDLSMSGASRLSTTGEPKIDENGHLSIDMSGASEVDNLLATGRGRLSVSMSGASKADLDATFNTLDIDVSGASRLKMSGDARTAEIDCSGASSVDLNGDYVDMEADVSGSSKVLVRGDLSTLKLEASGASKFEADGVTDRADIELSGVSKGKLTVRERMNYELSGVSTLLVRDLGATCRGEVSRGSQIEYLR